MTKSFSCPLKTFDAQITDSNKCDNNCAWYDTDHKGCAILIIAKAMTNPLMIYTKKG